jgi:solute carrier family 35 protein E1
MSIATMQLGFGCIWALFLWGYPDARSLPKISFDDWKATLPVGFCSAAAHAFSVFALSAGAVSFGQIVKAAEPAFAALIGTLFYGSKVSKAKWLCLIPVIGGVVMASLGELDFAWAALFTAALANVFAAFKANENKKLMDTEGLRDRIGSVGNQFALTMLNSFFFCLVLMFLTEGRKFGAFLKLCRTNNIVLLNLITSGLWFYAYNELATMTIKKTSAVTQSVANTAKRVIVIVGVAIVMKESLSPMKLIGCGIGIGGVFLYSVIDDLVKKKDSPALQAA